MTQLKKILVDKRGDKVNKRTSEQANKETGNVL